MSAFAIVVAEGRPAGADTVQIFKVPGASEQLRDGMEWLEADARNTLSKVHRLEVGNAQQRSMHEDRLNSWSRAELRAAMFSRLAEILRKPARERDAKETALHDWMQVQARDLRLSAAQHARAEYSSWEADHCYWPPAAFDDYDPGDACFAGRLDDLFTDPRPPTAEQFAAYGSYMALAESPVALDPQATALVRDTADGVALLGGLAGATLAGGLSAAALSTMSGAATAVAGAIFPYAATTSVGTAIGMAAGAVAFVIAVAVVAIVVSVIQGIAVFEDAEIPGELDAAVERARQLPDLADLLDTDEGTQQLFWIFLGNTLPDQLVGGDGIVGLSGGGGLGIGNGPTNPLTAPTLPGDTPFDLRAAGATIGERVTELALTSWDSVGSVKAGMNEGWFLIDHGNDRRELSLSLDYLDWEGDRWTAWVSDDVFIHVRDSEDRPSDPTCEDEDNCHVSHAIEFTAADGSQRLAKLDINHAPIFKPTVNGTPVEGGELLFRANAIDVDGDDLTVTWEFEVSCGELTDSPHCQPSVPSDHTRFEPALHGPNVRHAFADDGVHRVRLTATDDLGKSRTTMLQVVVANAIPEIRPDAPVPVDEGQPLRLTGRILDPGEEPVILTIDWGDGTTDRLVPDVSYRNEDGTLIVPPPCALGQACPRLQLADGGFTFDLDHTYLDDTESGEPFQISLTASDDGPKTAVVTLFAPIDNVAPSAVLTLQPSTLNEGDVVTLTGEIQDAGVRDTVTVAIPSLGVSIGVPAAEEVCEEPTSPIALPECHWKTEPLDASFVIPDDGGAGEPLVVEILVTDDDGGTFEDVQSLGVANVAPAVSLETMSTVDGDAQIQIDVVDPGADAILVEVDWGDGDAELIPMRTEREVVARHTYTASGVHTIGVLAVDDDGGIGRAEVDLTVHVPTRLPGDLDDRPTSSPNAPIATDAAPLTIPSGPSVDAGTPVATAPLAPSIPAPSAPPASLHDATGPLPNESDEDRHSAATSGGAAIQGSHEEPRQSIDPDGSLSQDQPPPFSGPSGSSGPRILGASLLLAFGALILRRLRRP
ncbi:MAG: hypothetical protein R3249_04085 [Nitriliruptorales bacterium]|nr:hypothetical protein [Nitriliruptorales bacterium]